MVRRQSLSGRRAFQRVHGSGRSWKGDGVRISYLLETVGLTRCAISVPKSCGNAVARNRIKRIWREAIRLSGILPPGEFHIMIRESEPNANVESATATLNTFGANLSA